MPNIVRADFRKTKVTTIGQSAFSYSRKLTKLYLPKGPAEDSVTQIDRYAFFRTNLIHKSQVKWYEVDCAAVTAAAGEDADTIFPFACVDTVYTYTSATTCTYANNGNAPCCGTATVIKIDATVTHVAYGAFKHCDTVHSVDTTEATSLEKIGSLAFTKMDSLTSADLSGATVLTHLGAESFYNCPQLAAVKLSSSIDQIGSHSFAGANLLDTVDTIDFNGVDCASMIVGKTNVFKFACPP